ncbi:hypothetical protein EG68_02714 [Paragonimus skrjabini miyazakii]|uniref:Endoplasmic reticulum junction formation protein lunapark n=1 Tax=Paragonimus skrjabini miyazakii TaxID=59628 RepID=A0A8S9Z7V7_9TREM|nr:hypothetical protein EG68_02714 [Paragonimus skrjabini miyazakii]
MGSIFAWLPRFFKRKEESIFERLEHIEEDLLNLESRRTSNIDTEKRFVFRLVVFSFILFGLGFIVIYYCCWPTTQTGKVILWTSFLVYPSIVGALKWAFRAFFLRRVSKTGRFIYMRKIPLILIADEKLKMLRESKQRLLEDVMENETFNRAQQILKRFDPLMFARLTTMEHASPGTPKTAQKSATGLASVLRKRKQEKPDGDNIGSVVQTPVRLINSKGSTEQLSAAPVADEGQQAFGIKPRLLRPILPRDRSVLDRLIDAVVGDGPDKRYALICRECASHNGMALQEEFEFLAFRCCYCAHFNPPRRARLQTPVPPNIVPTQKLRPTSSVEHLASTRPSSRASTPDPVVLRERSLSSSSSCSPTTTRTTARTSLSNGFLEVEEESSEQTITTESSTKP